MLSIFYKHQYYLEQPIRVSRPYPKSFTSLALAKDYFYTVTNDGKVSDKSFNNSISPWECRVA